MRAEELVFRASIAAVVVLLCLGAAWPLSAHAAPNPPMPRARPEPTYVFPDNSSMFVVFRFGAWVRVSYNNSQAVAPVAVYFYSKSGIPVTISDNYNHTVTGAWGLLLNLTRLDTKKPLELWVKYRGKTYHFKFRIVKALKEEKKKGKEITLSLQEFRSWLDREAQAATFLALLAFVLAVGVKRKTLLIGTFNSLNLALVVVASMVIYAAAAKTGHSKWLVAPFALSYLATYRVLPVGRRVLLIKIMPSMKRLLMENAILYRTAEGKLAYAKQTISEAIKRWIGKHIIVRDMETGKLGEISEDKLWTVEEIDTLSKYEALLVLDAELTKERIVEERGEGLYE